MNARRIKTAFKQIVNARRIKISLLIIVTIFALTSITVFAHTLAYRDRIYPGVKIESLDVGGMSMSEATSRVADTFTPRGQIDLIFKDKKWSADLEDIGAKVKAGQSAKKAMSVGRSAGFFAGLGQRYGAWRSGYPVRVAWTSDTKKTEAVLRKTAKEINQSPVDARLLIDQKNVAIEPHQDGQKLQFKKSLDRFRLAFYKKSKKIELAVKTWEPDKTTKEIKDLRIERQLAEYSTSLNPAKNGRRLNIELAMSKIDGVYIAPGETFSFNRIVGPRTRKAGFKTAPVILGGRLVPGIGGGICQVATTLYNAAMISGMPILDRSVHSFFISHYPTGRDATVVDGAIDFKFRNDTKGTLLIKMFILKNSVGFKIYGPDGGRKNTFGEPHISNVTPYSSKTETDTALPPGARVVSQSGITGRTVTVIRKVMSKGKILLEEKIFSRYTPRQEIITVGPEPPPPETTETPTPAGDSSATNPPPSPAL